jgi:hypothetical protein
MAGSPYVRIDAPMTWNRRRVRQAMIATKASHGRASVLLRRQSPFAGPVGHRFEDSIDIKRYACNGR